MEYIKLKYIAKYPTGKLNSNEACEDGRYPFFTCSHELYYINKYSYDGEYVLLGGNNASGDFPIFYYYGKFDAYQRTYLIQPINESQYNTRYLYYSISLKLRQMKNNAAGTATKFLTKPILNNILIESFSIEQQKRIADILSKYDELIEVNNKRIKILEQTAEELYKEWFVRFRFPGHETAQFENGLPKGWRIDNLGNYANVFTGKSNRQDAIDEGEYVFFDRSQEIKHSSIWLYDCEGIIIPGEGTSFIPRYYKGKFDLHQRCYCVQPNSSIFGMYMFYYLMLNRHYFLTVATGATVPSLRLKNFTSMKFLIPSEDILKRFGEIVNKTNNFVSNLKQQNDNLIKQRDLLLPRLMSGKLEV